MLKSPNFWRNKGNTVSKVLGPISKLYYYASSLRYNSVTPERAAVPVICAGNITLGGAGKTPTVALVCQILNKHGFNPNIISGGYGGYLKNVVKVDPAKHYYLQVGDEALLSSLVAPTWVGKNRVKAAKAAELSGADVLVMDDGFQNNSLEKDFKILVIDSGQAFGNEMLFPAGPLRESVKSGVKKSDVVLIIGEKNDTIEEKVLEIRSNIKIYYAKIKAINNIQTENNKVLGFCGIGYPEKFRKTLKECGFDIVDFVSFADHHPYTITEIQKLIRAAEKLNATLVTTQKDYVKVPDVFRPRLQVVEISLEPNCDGFESDLLAALEKYKSNYPSSEKN